MHVWNQWSTCSLHYFGPCRYFSSRPGSGVNRLLYTGLCVAASLDSLTLILSVCCCHPAPVWSAVPVTSSYSLLPAFLIETHIHADPTVTHGCSFLTVAKGEFLHILACFRVSVRKKVMLWQDEACELQETMTMPTPLLGPVYCCVQRYTLCTEVAPKS